MIIICRFISCPLEIPKNTVCVFSFFFNFTFFGNIKKKCVPVYDIEVSFVESFFLNSICFYIVKCYFYFDLVFVLQLVPIVFKRLNRLDFKFHLIIYKLLSGKWKKADIPQIEPSFFTPRQKTSIIDKCIQTVVDKCIIYAFCYYLKHILIKVF